MSLVLAVTLVILGASRTGDGHDQCQRQPPPRRAADGPSIPGVAQASRPDSKIIPWPLLDSPRRYPYGAALLGCRTDTVVGPRSGSPTSPPPRPGSHATAPGSTKTPAARGRPGPSLPRGKLTQPRRQSAESGAADCTGPTWGSRPVHASPGPTPRPRPRTRSASTRRRPVGRWRAGGDGRRPEVWLARSGPARCATSRCPRARRRGGGTARPRASRPGSGNTADTAAPSTSWPPTR